MNKQHWDNIHATKNPDQVSWFAPHLEISLQLIDRIALPPTAAIIDVGGGQSTLVDDLLARGYQDLSVLDISRTAIEANRKRLGKNAGRVHWLVDDITTAPLQSTRYHLWHDRAVFHFLTTAQDRAAYMRRLTTALKPGGHLILATFGLDGPIRCSGLDAVRYSAHTLHRELGSRFRLIESSTQLHHTPSGATQQFLYCHFSMD
jgi:SAM-dependent methyltransferase